MALQVAGMEKINSMNFCRAPVYRMDFLGHRFTVPILWELGRSIIHYIINIKPLIGRTDCCRASVYRARFFRITQYKIESKNVCNERPPRIF
jgi:hypothetical protein